MSYKVLTPAGFIKVKSITEAREYQKMYGYPFTHMKLNQSDETLIQEREEEQEAWEREMYG